MSKLVSAVLSPVTSLLGMGKNPAMPAIPAPQVPAAPAPTRRTDTGANIVVGAEDVKNTRVSGTRKSATSSSGNVLGGLGRSGLSI